MFFPFFLVFFSYVLLNIYVCKCVYVCYIVSSCKGVIVATHTYQKNVATFARQCCKYAFIRAVTMCELQENISKKIKFNEMEVNVK